MSVKGTYSPVIRKKEGKGVAGGLHSTWFYYFLILEGFNHKVFILYKLLLYFFKQKLQEISFREVDVCFVYLPFRIQFKIESSNVTLLLIKKDV